MIDGQGPVKVMETGGSNKLWLMGIEKVCHNNG